MTLEDVIEIRGTLQGFEIGSGGNSRTGSKT